MANRAKKTAAVEAAETTTALTTYKGFGKDWKCRDYQYELGQTYQHDGGVVRCAGGGFHSCEMPLDIWTYYPPNTSRFAEVIASGEIDKGKENDDTKLASAKITINVELSIGDLTRRAVRWVADMAKKQGNGGYAEGSNGHASAAGSNGHASAAGSNGHASAAGSNGHASAAGDYGHASAAGYRGHASAAGYRGHASAAGSNGHASAAGYRGHASAAGSNGHASAAGDYGHAEVKGVSSIAHAPGIGGSATAVEGSAISLAAYDDNVWPPKLVAVRSSMVGENGIKAGKRYRLTTAGEFEVVTDDQD